MERSGIASRLCGVLDPLPQMRDGPLILQFEHGQVVGMRSNSGLDHVYERLFRNAHRAAKKSATSVEPGIRLVVFGSFWLEARANAILRNALTLEVRESPFASTLWEALKRAALPEKLDLLLVLASVDLQSVYGDLSKRVRSLLDLRNRLAHFKDSDTAVTGPVSSLKEAIKLMAAAEDPPLVRGLKRPEVLKHADTVSNVARWLTQLEKAHAKRRGIKISRKKGLTTRPRRRASRAAEGRR